MDMSFDDVERSNSFQTLRKKKQQLRISSSELITQELHNSEVSLQCRNELLFSARKTSISDSEVVVNGSCCNEYINNIKTDSSACTSGEKTSLLTCTKTTMTTCSNRSSINNNNFNYKYKRRVYLVLLSNANCCLLAAVISKVLHLKEVHRFAKCAKTLNNCPMGFLMLMAIAMLLGFTDMTEAGACWLQRMDNGKCKELYSKNVSREECCRRSQEFAYTDKDLSDAEYFFTAAIGGGTSCISCLDSCDIAKCGPEKRCVIRKGRPRCICAPVCKASKEKKLKKHPIRVVDLEKSEKLAQLTLSIPKTRKIRSLSDGMGHKILEYKQTESTTLIENNNNNSNLNNNNNNINNNSNQNIKKKNNNKYDNESQRKISNSAKRRKHQGTNRIRHHRHHHHHNQKHQKNHKRIMRTNNTAVDTSELNRIKFMKIQSDKESSSDVIFRNDLKSKSRTIGTVASRKVIATLPVNSSLEQEIQHQTHIQYKKFDQVKEEETASQNITIIDIKAGNIRPHKVPLPLHQVPQSEADELTLDEKIRAGFFNHGFPYPPNDLMQLTQGRYYNPVCGTDGKTYKTECQLKKRACRQATTSLTVAYRGHCQTSCKHVRCLHGLTCVEDQYGIPHCISCKITCQDDASSAIDPARAVCGVDGQTYRNVCDINRMICITGRSIAVAYNGPCQDEANCNTIHCENRKICLTDLVTHKPRCVSCSFKCPRRRRPQGQRYEDIKICGNNNHTYQSWCQMRRDSCNTEFYIDIRHVGACHKDSFSIEIG